MEKTQSKSKDEKKKARVSKGYRKPAKKKQSIPKTLRNANAVAQLRLEKSFKLNQIRSRVKDMYIREFRSLRYIANNLADDPIVGQFVKEIFPGGLTFQRVFQLRGPAVDYSSYVKNVINSFMIQTEVCSEMLGLFNSMSFAMIDDIIKHIEQHNWTLADATVIHRLTRETIDMMAKMNMVVNEQFDRVQGYAN